MKKSGEKLTKKKTIGGKTLAWAHRVLKKFGMIAPEKKAKFSAQGAALKLTRRNKELERAYKELQK